VSSPWPRHEPWKSFTPYRRPHCFLAVVLLPQERKWLMGRTQLYTTCVLLFFLLAGMLNSGPHASTQALCQLSHSVRLFFLMLSIFEIGSCELFAQAGFKLLSFWSLPAE
jgi:hypothetical protein